MKLPEARPDDPDWSLLREHDNQELWDHSIRPHVASAYAARLKQLIALVTRSAPPGGRVLDVGCAQGTLGLMLAEQGFRVTLLDVREKNIDYARARHEQGEVAFYAGLLGAGMPPDSDYDVVLCTEVLEHVIEPSQLLRELASKTARGGAVVLTTPNAEYMLSSLPTFGSAPQTTIDTADRNSADGDAHRFLYSKEELIALVRGIGLSLEAHGFFLPLWLEGHAKLRYLHAWFYRRNKRIVELPASLSRSFESAARRLCSSQWLVARRT